MPSFELNDKALNNAFKKIKSKMGGHSVSKELFYTLRDKIHEIVGSCVDNIEVVIYMDDVLDDPLTITVGPGDNRLRITIRDSGRITYSWTKETWAKFFSDVYNGLESLAKSILGTLAQGIRENQENMLETEARKAIGYSEQSGSASYQRDGGSFSTSMSYSESDSD